MAPTQANIPDREFPGPEGRGEGGLLEQPSWRIGAADERRRRQVWGPTGRLVGLSYERHRPWWLRWLRPWLEVYEAGDQPLVFSVMPALSLGRRQLVHDAEGDLVGSTDRSLLRDRWGRALLRQRAHTDRRSGDLVGAGGEVVARWAAADGELTLELTGGSLPGPFERMLALAAALSEVTG